MDKDMTKAALSLFVFGDLVGAIWTFWAIRKK